MFGSSGRFGTSFCQVSQSSVCGDKSGGGGYSHAPVGSFRPFQPSTSVRSPSTPCAIISLRSEEHTSELQSQSNLVCRLLLEKKKKHATEFVTTSRTRGNIDTNHHAGCVQDTAVLPYAVGLPPAVPHHTPPHASSTIMPSRST